MMTNLKKVFISSKGIRLISMPTFGGLFYSRFLRREEFPIIPKKVHRTFLSYVWQRKKRAWRQHAFTKCINVNIDVRSIVTPVFIQENSPVLKIAAI